MDRKITDHFDYDEENIACPCCNRLKINDRFYHHMELLEDIRSKYGKPIKINSGYRCPAHNHAVEGKEHSQHLEFATDIRPEWAAGDEEQYLADVRKLKDLAVLTFDGVGYYDTFVHCDLRGVKVYWDDRKNTKS